MKILVLALALVGCTTEADRKQMQKCDLACLAGTATFTKKACVSWWRGLGCECFSGETFWIK
jgi:hypothetical protein